MSKVYLPILLLDEETTGLLPVNPHILEIALYLEDYGYFGTPKESRLFQAVIMDELDPARCSDEAMKLNAELLKEIEDARQGIYKRPKNVYMSSSEMLTQLNAHVNMFYNSIKNEEFLMRGQKYFKLQMAGKNINRLDIPVLENYGFKFNEDQVDFRTLDIGAMYYVDYGRVPSLTELVKDVLKRKQTHQAVQDCYDSAELIYKKVIR